MLQQRIQRGAVRCCFRIHGRFHGLHIGHGFLAGGHGGHSGTEIALRVFAGRRGHTLLVNAVEDICQSAHSFLYPGNMDFFPGEPFFQPVEGDGINSIARAFQPFRRVRLGQLVTKIPARVELIIRIRHGSSLRSGFGLCLGGLLGGCCGLNGGRIHSFIAVAVLHQLDGQRVVSLQHIAGNDVLKLCHYDSSFLLLCALLLENQVRGDDLGAVVIEQADGGRLGQRNLFSGIGVGHDRLGHRAVNHQDIVTASGQVGAALDLDTVPCVELLSSGVHIGARHLVEVVADFAIVGGGRHQTHHLAGHTIHKIVGSVFGFLNDLLQLIFDACASGDSHLDGFTVCGFEEVFVQLCGHAQNMVCSAAVKNAVNAIQLDILLFHLFDDFLVGVDSNGHGLCLDLAAFASLAGSAIVCRGGVCKALCLHSASGRVAGQVGVLHASRNQRFLHVLNDLAIQLGQILLASVGGQDAKGFDSCHSGLPSFRFRKFWAGCTSAPAADCRSGR
nr:MAG TPA: hypothetical protein [Caudoviricetes sp.]